MGDPVRIAAVRDYPSEPFGDAEPTIGLGQQYDPAVGTDPPTIKGGCDLLAANGWKANGRRLSSLMAGVARRSQQRIGFNNRILCQISRLCYFRHPKICCVMNRMG